MSMVLTKAIRLVDMVAEGIDTLSEISTKSDMSKSTTHRILTTLVKHQYLSFEGRKYALGNRLFELGAIRRRRFDFVETLRPILSQYALDTGDTIHLAILDGQDILLVDRVFGNRQLRINSYPGLRAPAYSAAVGKVLIGHAPRDNWSGFLRDVPADYPRTEEKLLRDFSLARQTNVGFDMDECNIGTSGVASSFFLNSSTRIACSINGATVYFADGRLEALSDTVKRMAAELRQRLMEKHADTELSF